MVKNHYETSILFANPRPSVTDLDDRIRLWSKNLEPKSQSLKLTVIKNVSFDDDDDCIILDADPEKPLLLANNDDVTDSDDLLILGHKGQIACRDYPHPRHLCAKYPFTSTPHEKHCDQCHCYVCDSLAPCCHWGTDHCHATDKEETWKAMRKSFKLAKDAPVPVLKFPCISQSVALPQVNHVQPRNIIRLAPNSMPQNQFSRMTTILQNHPNSMPQNQFPRPTTLPQNHPNTMPQKQYSRPTTIPQNHPNSMPQNQFSSPTTMPQNQFSGPTIPQNLVSRLTTIHACSSTTKFVHPNIISHGKTISLGKNGFQLRSVLQQSVGVQNNVIQKDRGPNIGNSGPRFAPFNAMLQRAGFLGVPSATNQSTYVSSNNSSSAHASQYSRNYVRPATLKDSVNNVSCDCATTHSRTRYPAPPATSKLTNHVGRQNVRPATSKDPVSNVSCTRATQHSKYPAPPLTSKSTNHVGRQGVRPVTSNDPVSNVSCDLATRHSRTRYPASPATSKKTNVGRQGV
ncbi:hypothetical protein CFOL_v3_27624 [Cephalotus follicularis]|uniref:Uncharacterized protein n=1 Tax=Cephalotus follicularis TaxID=3775 RepID=A0A1Q3CVD1_CEPFO|nr:hypothetical protein CFOL_v3_27624 [Cephalotus follicularis]